MNFTRRETMAVSGAALLATTLPLKLLASTPDLISGVTGGIEASGDGISLTAPEIAENGNTVPISIDAPGAVAITVLAAGNPTPGVAKFNFGELEADSGQPPQAEPLVLPGSKELADSPDPPTSPELFSLVSVAAK